MVLYFVDFSVSFYFLVDFPQYAPFWWEIRCDRGKGSPSGVTPTLEGELEQKSELVCFAGAATLGLSFQTGARAANLCFGGVCSSERSDKIPRGRFFSGMWTFFVVVSVLATARPGCSVSGREATRSATLRQDFMQYRQRLHGTYCGGDNLHLVQGRLHEPQLGPNVRLEI